MTTTLLHNLLDTAARRAPGSSALSLADRTMTYAQLDAASRRTARWLRSRGVRTGDRVVVIAPNRLATVSLVYACSRIGAAFVLLHERGGGIGLAHVLDDAEPALLVTDSLDALDAATGRGIATARMAEVDTA